jgi:outer membrane protein assembly factor BamD (BamD/ComL family)
MEKSYRKLGLNQLADDAHQILTKTFPESVYVAGAPEKPWWKFW